MPCRAVYRTTTRSAAPCAHAHAPVCKHPPCAVCKHGLRQGWGPFRDFITAQVAFVCARVCAFAHCFPAYVRVRVRASTHARIDGACIVHLPACVPLHTPAMLHTRLSARARACPSACAARRRVIVVWAACNSGVGCPSACAVRTCAHHRAWCACVHALALGRCARAHAQVRRCVRVRIHANAHKAVTRLRVP